MSQATSAAPGIKWYPDQAQKEARRARIARGEKVGKVSPSSPSEKMLAESRVTIPVPLRPAYPDKHGKPKVQLTRGLHKVTLAEAIKGHDEHVADRDRQFAALAKADPATWETVLANHGVKTLRERRDTATLARFILADLATRHPAPDDIKLAMAGDPVAAYKVALPGRAAARLPGLSTLSDSLNAAADAIDPDAKPVTNDPDAPATWTVRYLVEQFHKRPDIGTSTAKNHKNHLRAFLAFLGAKADGLASDVTPWQCQRFIDEAKARNTTRKVWGDDGAKRTISVKPSPGSINVAIASVKAVFNMGARLEAFAKSPAAQIKTMKDKRGRSEKRRGYTADEADAMLAQAFTVWGENDPRTLAMRLIRVTGARNDEIASMPREGLIEHKYGGLCVAVRRDVIDEDADDDGRDIKNAGSDRLVPVHGRLADALRKHAAKVKPGERLFNVGDASRFGGMIRGEIMDLLRMALAPILAPAHSFRHAFITETRNLGGSADVKHYLTGHANGGGSERDIYGEQGLAVVREFIDRMWEGVAV